MNTIVRIRLTLIVLFVSIIMTECFQANEKSSKDITSDEMASDNMKKAPTSNLLIPDLSITQRSLTDIALGAVQIIVTIGGSLMLIFLAWFGITFYIPSICNYKRVCRSTYEVVLKNLAGCSDHCLKEQQYLGIVRSINSYSPPHTA